MNITPEQLKALAERAGHEAEIRQGLFNTLNCYIQAKGEKGFNHIYNPLTNDSQMKELLEMLIHEGIYHIRGGANPNDVHVRDKDYVLVAKGKTINEAVTRAATAMEEGRRWMKNI